MASALDMPLDDIIRAKKEGGRGRTPKGQGVPAAGGYVYEGGLHRPGGGVFGDTFYGSSALGPIRRNSFSPSFRASPYMPLKKDSDGPWKHDLFEDGVSTKSYNGPIAGIETGTKVLISNLDYAVSDADIKELFSEVGDVKWSSVRYDRSGRSEGSAEVLYSRRADAVMAVKRYHDVLLDGKPMKVQIKGTNLSIPSFPADGTAPAGIRDRGMFGGFQANGLMPQPAQVHAFTPGNRALARGNRALVLGNGGRGKDAEKMRADLDAELEQYHAEAKKISK